MSKAFYVVVASKAQKSVPLDEVVYTSTGTGSVARFATFEEACKKAELHAKSDRDSSFIVMKAMTVYASEPKVTRKSLLT